MPAVIIGSFGMGLWTTWVAIGMGTLVASLVLCSTVLYGRVRARRRRLTSASREEDVAWEDLLAMLEKRNRDRALAGLPPEEATQQELDQLLAKLQPVEDPGPLEWPEDRVFEERGGSEKRANRRRWGNPTEVFIRSLLWNDNLHGIVINRSTGGLGIFVDSEVPAGTPMQIRAKEAPPYVPPVLVEVRHCLKLGKGCVLGCQFTAEVPWNARVWFG